MISTPKTIAGSAVAAGVALFAFASPGLAAHCGVLTGDQFCDVVNVAAAGPFDEGTSNNDNIFGDGVPFLVNQDMILGNSNWLYGGQYDLDAMSFSTDDQTFDPMFTLIGNSISGSFSVGDSLLGMFGDVMLVLSTADDDAAEGGPDALDYYGYLLTASTGLYNFASPFPNTPGDHISVYASPIPVPAALPLLATALGGIGFMGRRRRKTAA